MHRVVVIDDHEPSLKVYKAVIERMLGGQVVPFTDPREALNYVSTSTPTLIILDQNMPDMDGLQVVHELRGRDHRSRAVPIIMLTGLDDPVLKSRAMDAGVNTFLTKPIGAEEFAGHVKRLSAASRVRFDDDVTATYSLHPEIEPQPKEKPATEHSRDSALLLALFRAYEARDLHAAKRMRLAGEVAMQLAIECRCSPYDVQLIREAGFVYDIGKLAIPEKILTAPTALSPAARKHVNAHCEAGAQILNVPGSRLLEAAAQMALEHHERYDGEGYPNRLKGTAISLPARVIAVADAFIAMLNKRADRPAMPFGHALATIKRQSGTHFDPAVVTALEKIQNNVAERIREAIRA